MLLVLSWLRSHHRSGCRLHCASFLAVTLQEAWLAVPVLLELQLSETQLSSEGLQAVILCLVPQPLFLQLLQARLHLTYWLCVSNIGMKIPRSPLLCTSVGLCEQRCTVLLTALHGAGTSRELASAA